MTQDRYMYTFRYIEDYLSCLLTPRQSSDLIGHCLFWRHSCDAEWEVRRKDNLRYYLKFIFVRNFLSPQDQGSIVKTLVIMILTGVIMAENALMRLKVWFRYAAVPWDFLDRNVTFLSNLQLYYFYYGEWLLW